MNVRRTAILAVALALLGFTSAAQGTTSTLTVTDMNHGVTAQQLAASIVGSGVAISNVTYTGAANAAGTFSGGTGLTGFDSGIVLGSGSVQSTNCTAGQTTAAPRSSDGRPTPGTTQSCSPKGVSGPNEYDGNTTDNSGAGDADLDTLSGKITHDAAVLEFDFVPDATALQFRYVFSSDEYNEYTNSAFNDTFALLVNGANCAIVPGTSNTAVGVNTINGGNPFGTAATHPELFLNNDYGDLAPGPYPYYTEMDGLTVPLQCTAPVNPGVTNHLKLAIADASDYVLDSNVFIAGGSVIASGHTLEGHIWNTTAGNPVAGAFVQACPNPADTGCRVTQSLPGGAYEFDNLPDHTSGGGAVDHTWTLGVNPPFGSNLFSTTAGPFTINGFDSSGNDVILAGPTGIPAGTSLTTPSGGTQTTGTPSVYWGEPITITTTGCAGGTGTATLDVSDGYTQTVPLTEGAAGHYTATFAPPYPHHGSAAFSWNISCGTSGGFNVYIDPSGVVKTVGGDPIDGATVTLYRSDDPGGPFVAVPNGSAIMSPSNQANPDATDALGQFGWDVIAGYYKVRAEKTGCTAAGGTPAYVESTVMDIPPPVTNLDLRLDCGGPETTIQTGPPNPSKKATADLTFTSDDPAATFECRLDGSPWAACVTPKNYFGLTKRSHLFEVRAVAGGVVDSSPAQWPWTNGKKPKGKITVFPASLANSATAAFTFASSDPGAHYQCAIDSIGAFADCTSPASFGPLGEGQHVFYLKAIDAAGRWATTSKKWTIDLTAPTVTLLSHPPDPSTSTTARFTYKSSEKGSSFLCFLDLAQKSCKSSITYKNLAPGAHWFEVAAIDAAGNQGPWLGYGWTIS